MTKKVTACLNCEHHRNSHLFYKKIFKSMIKKIQRSELVNILIEMKILNQDYLTKELTLSKPKTKLEEKGGK